MADAKTLTVEEIDEVLIENIENDDIRDIAAQAKRVPELEAEVARLTVLASGFWETAAIKDVARLAEECDRYRKVAEEALRLANWTHSAVGVSLNVMVLSPLVAALAAVGMKVEE